jgi:Domain of unknown function (DUF4267)
MRHSSPCSTILRHPRGGSSVAAMDTAQTIRSLSGIRMAIGTSAWATPRLAGKAFGLDSDSNPQSPYLARLFGIRDLALGVGTLTTTGESQRRWLALGLLCDAADAAAGVLAGRAGYLPKIPTVLVTGTALVAAGLGAAALADSNGAAA